MNIRELLDSNRTLIMGILNVTPDSFFDGSKYNSIDKALAHAEEMIKGGADILDIGGESTRPGAEQVDEKEELNRILPVTKEITKRYAIPVSIDTYKAKVAQAALDAGASMINDISGLRFDNRLAPILAETGAPVVIMHMKGTPKTMQNNPGYEDAIAEIKNFFSERIGFACNCGIRTENIIIDPGIGFGKTTQQNLEILANIREFAGFGSPVMIGASRKSFLGRILASENNPAPAEKRLEGSIAVSLWAAYNGVKVLRVHDVKETNDALRIFERIKNVTNMAAVLQ